MHRRLKLLVTIVPAQHVIMKHCARHSEKRIKRELGSLLLFCGQVIYGNIFCEGDDNEKNDDLFIGTYDVVRV